MQRSSSAAKGPIILACILIVLGGGVYGLGRLLASRGYGQQPDPALVLPALDDHTHADYSVVLCGAEQPIIPGAPGEVHTHGDGRIHVHPSSAATSGAAANLGLFFRTHGGSFSRDALDYPGAGRTWRNGDTCPDGNPGTLGMTVNGAAREDFDRYVPQDGDVVVIRFDSSPDAAP